MEKVNADVRKRISDAGLKYWQVADAVGISETTLYVWMRHELAGERRARVLNAISDLAAQRKEESV